ncbi:TadA family conjugal transfer-associated ATPase [Acidipropionibacterium jensenii]|uniref:TadA family conjugal transfer-associated ATPase n=1 Tax=Acidipropionibacterium jensenii TaxID=1749 RepID=UPI00214B3B9B|nr:TadA family conjugal transfer-associated ATPase [Acidipropionibacterium jensenii]
MADPRRSAPSGLIQASATATQESAVPAVVEQVRAKVACLGHAWTPIDVAGALVELGQVASDRLVLAVVEELRRTSTGAGRLEPLLAIEGVTDVLVNGPDNVYIDRGRGLERVDVGFTGPAEVRALATRLAARVGRRLDDGCPWVDARLADGTRVHAVLDVLAEPGTCISLRVPARRRLSLADWRACGGISSAGLEALQEVLSRRLAFLISGGTGSGKTTLLSSMLSALPGGERLVVVEDSRELVLDHPHWIGLEARVANSEGRGEVTLTDLVRQSLRMRPDRVVLGEVRGAELRDMLMALNTGHEGGCGTVHANGVEEVPARLEALAALGGLSREAAQAQIAAALSVVIHLSRGPRVRAVRQIGVVTRGGAGVEVVTAVRWDEDGRPCGGPGAGRLAELIGERLVDRLCRPGRWET